MALAALCIEVGFRSTSTVPFGSEELGWHVLAITDMGARGAGTGT